MIHAVNRNHIRSRASDMRAHLVQKCRDVDNLRLLRRVFNRRAAFCVHRRHHDIDCCADRGNIQEDFCTDQFFRFDRITTFLIINLRSQRFKALEMQIDRPRAQITAARHFDFYMLVFA